MTTTNELKIRYILAMIVLFSSCVGTFRTQEKRGEKFINLKACLPNQLYTIDFSKKELTTLDDSTYKFSIEGKELRVDRHNEFGNTYKKLLSRDNTLRIVGAIEFCILSNSRDLVTKLNIEESQLVGKLFRDVTHAKTDDGNSVTHYIEFVTMEKMVLTSINHVKHDTAGGTSYWKCLSRDSINALIMPNLYCASFFIKNYESGKLTTLSVENNRVRTVTFIESDLKPLFKKSQLIGEWIVAKQSTSNWTTLSTIKFTEDEILIDGMRIARWELDRFGTTIITSSRDKWSTIGIEYSNGHLEFSVQGVTYSLKREP